MEIDPKLILNFIVATVAAAVNLSYLIRHSNNKRYIRLFSAIILGYFALINLLVVIERIPEAFASAYFRPWMPVLFLLPVFDAMIDWKIKD